ncbi:Hypothetical predicted protein [Podarcis lilfordi]|uniref:Uncharacterized protein n=1 Tax=Podarcis lilfordi TaxID=74358 RepID=A0AA35LLX7_9SAUR|nr:Hypothetical predicted protein [Podarcis lilfordi]
MAYLCVCVCVCVLMCLFTAREGFPGAHQMQGHGQTESVQAPRSSRLQSMESYLVYSAPELFRQHFKNEAVPFLLQHTLFQVTFKQENGMMMIIYLCPAHLTGLPQSLWVASNRI